MVTNFSPPMEKPLAKALSEEVKAAARVLMSSWESCGRWWVRKIVFGCC
jgi:hypothetical protein